MEYKTPDPETLARAGMHGASFDWRDPLRLESLLTRKRCSSATPRATTRRES